MTTSQPHTAHSGPRHDDYPSREFHDPSQPDYPLPCATSPRDDPNRPGASPSDKPYLRPTVRANTTNQAATRHGDPHHRDYPCRDETSRADSPYQRRA